MATLKRHITHVSLSRGQTLFTLGDTIDNLYIIESGRLTLEWPMVGARADNAAEGGDNPNGQAGPVRVVEFGPGCLVGAQVGPQTAVQVDQTKSQLHGLLHRC